MGGCVSHIPPAPGHKVKRKHNMAQKAEQEFTPVVVYKPGTKEIIAQGEADDLLDMTRPDGEPAKVPMWRVKDCMYDKGFTIGLPDKKAKTKAALRAEEKERQYARIREEQKQEAMKEMRAEVRAEVLAEIEAEQNKGKAPAKKDAKKPKQ